MDRRFLEHSLKYLLASDQIKRFGILSDKFPITPEKLLRGINRPHTKDMRPLLNKTLANFLSELL